MKSPASAEAVYRMGLLIVDKPRTATYLAAKMDVSKPIAYARIYELRRRAHAIGSRLEVTRVREGKTGPLSRAYQLVPAEPSKRRRAS